MKINLKNNSKGYSLVEMIIVIAIIALLTGLALLSVTIITSARAKDSAMQFDTLVSECITKNKNMTPGTNDPKGNPYDGFAIAVYKRNATSSRPEQFIIAPVYYSEKGGITGGGHYSPIYDIDNTSSNDCKDSILHVHKSVSMTFKGTTYTNSSPQLHNLAYIDEIQPKSGGDEWVFIRFDKKGNCVSGYGEYKFYKKNGNVVSRVIIRKNGSHEVK